jgi:hypothetical protein
LYGKFDVGQAHLREDVVPTARWRRRSGARSQRRECDITGKVVEWRDEKTVGLTLRITRRKVVWYVRRREVTLRLGTAADIPLEDARYYADRIRLAAGRHRDLRAFVGALIAYPAPDPRMIRDYKFDREMDERYTRGMAQREKAKMLPTGPASPFWTWKELTDNFLKYQKPKLKLKYRKQYEHYLTLKEFEAINGKLVPTSSFGISNTSEMRYISIMPPRPSIELSRSQNRC